MRDRMPTRRERRKDGLWALVATAVIVGMIAVDRSLDSPEVDQLESEISPELDAMMGSVRDPLIFGEQDGDQLPLMNESRALPYEGITVVLDAGHGLGNTGEGLYDPGAVYEDTHESRIVLDQALRVGEILESQGFNVVYTRTNEGTGTPLASRAITANNVGADIFVSFHVNSYEDNSVQGVRTYHYPGSVNGSRLARTIGNSLVEELRESTHGFNQGYDPVRGRDFDVLRRTTMPAVLLESGFLTNARDRDYLVNLPQEVAEGIAEGIVEYFANN
jgi:N-acetylmuramoyl-L-alanine amidase